LTIEHPVQRVPLLLEAPYPDDFAGALDYLRRTLVESASGVWKQH
jgi:hypothetical protein